MSIGKSYPRIDAYEKVTGRAKYTDDLADKNMLVGKILHSTIANGLVKSMDISEAEKLPGVEKIITCFDVPDFLFPTAGHPWELDIERQDVADRLLLSPRVRLYGDDIGAVIAKDELTARKALDLIKVEYEEYPVMIDPQEAMKDGANQLHEKYPNNILGHSLIENGDFEDAISEKGLVKVEGWYDVPIVQHCHIEPAISYAYEELGKIVVVSATQIPQIVRRVVGQALGIPWGQVRIIKPFLGGGFGNRQDSLYEPLNAYLTTQVGGRPVKLELTREEIFYDTRVRHGMKIHIESYTRPNGRLVARSCKIYSNQGAYASHGHSIAGKSGNAFKQLYNDEKATRVESYTVFTNTAAGGAMRGYGTPQIVFAMESHAEDIAKKLGMESIEFRKLNMMPVNYYDDFSKNVNYFDSYNQCIEKGREYIDWDKKIEMYKNQTGPIRKGVGMSLFWYNTAVWPISVELSGCRMMLNQDGSVQLQLAETEIGQGADTVFAQMASHTLGIPFEKIHTVTNQDTDVTPFGTGAYGSRQTYVGGMSVSQTAIILKDKILDAAREFTRMRKENLDIVDGNIVLKTLDNKILMGLDKLATDLLYSETRADHLTAESLAQCRSNAYSLGCCFAEVEVDIPLGKIKLLDIVNVHDCGQLINPMLAAGQVHGGQSMSIGYGLSEQMLYDAKTGKLLNDNLLDYKLSTTMDHPDLEAQFVENYEPTSPYGTKALGEPPAVPCAPAIRNALLNACGVSVNKAPLSPHVLIPAFKEAGLI